MTDRARQAPEAVRQQAAEENRRLAEGLAAVSQLAIDLAAAPPEADLLVLITDSLQSTTGALLTSVSTYDASSRELVIRRIATQSKFLARIIHILGRDPIGVRLPVSPELYREMVQDVVRIEKSLWVTTFRAIPRPVAASVQKALGIKQFVGVALAHGEELLGTVVLAIKRGKASPPVEVMQPFAHLAAVSLQRRQMEELLQQRNRELEQRMQELAHAQAQLVQSAKMAAFGELAAGVAHELNNPLTSVLGFSELLLERDKAGDEWTRSRLEAISRQAGKARDIVRCLLDFARQREVARDEVDLNAVLQETLALIRQRLEKSHVTIEEHYAPDLPSLLLDAGRIKQAFLNLYTNALQAMPLGGTLTVRTQATAGQVLACIADTGEGIPADCLPRIFEPFFTTRPTGDGTGLGLSVSLGIVQEHGGRIEVESQAGKGSTFTVRLPISDA